MQIISEADHENKNPFSISIRRGSEQDHHFDHGTGDPSEEAAEREQP